MAENRPYIHVSFDLVDEFIPRIPNSRAIGVYEDDKTPRICVSPSLLSSLQALPGSGEVARVMCMAGMPVIIHAYYLTSGHVHIPTKEEVPDAKETGEVWILETPEEVKRVDYELVHPAIRKYRSANGPDRYRIDEAEFKRVMYWDNKQELAARVTDMIPHSEAFLRILEKSSFRDVMVVFSELLDKEREEERKKIMGKSEGRN